MSTSVPPPGGPTGPTGHHEQHGRYDQYGPTGEPRPTGRYDPPQPSSTDQFFDGVRRVGIMRSDDRWVAGVAGGLSMRAGLDPLVGRALFVLAAFFGGLGLVAYGIGWALLPEQRDGRIHVQELFRGRFDIAVLGAFVTAAVGLSSSGWIGPWWGFWGGDRWTGAAWAGVIVLITVVVVAATRSNQNTQTAPPGPGPAADPYRSPQASSATPGRAEAPAPPTTAADAARASGETMDPAAPASAAPTSAAPATPGSSLYLGASAQASPATAYGGRPPATAYGGGGEHGSGEQGSGGHGGRGYGSGGYGSGGYGIGGYGGPPHPPVPPAPPKPVVRGAGATATGVVVGLGLLTFAGLMIASRYYGWDGPVVVTAGAVTVVLAGLGIALAGARGRSSGGLGAVAVLTAIAVLPMAALQPVSWTTHGIATAVGQLDQTPLSVTEARRGYSIGAGDARIDLTDLPLPDDGALVEVPISVGAGEVTVTMPRDGAYTATVQVLAGEVRWIGERVRSGVGNQVVELESPAVQDGASPQVHLDISVGAGQARVDEVRVERGARR